MSNQRFHEQFVLNCSDEIPVNLKILRQNVAHVNVIILISIHNTPNNLVTALSISRYLKFWLFRNLQFLWDNLLSEGQQTVFVRCEL